MVIVIIGSEVDGRHPKIVCDVQIEQGKIIPTEILEFKIQNYNF